VLWLPCDRGLLVALRKCLICKRLEVPEVQVVAGAILVGVLCQRCNAALASVAGLVAHE